MEWLYGSLVTARVVIQPIIINDVGRSYKYLEEVVRAKCGGISNLSQSCVSRKHINDVDLESPKGAPGTVKDILNPDEGHKKLDETQRKMFVSCVQRALFLSPDRQDIVYTEKGLMRRAKDPDVEQWSRLERLDRFLIIAPNVPAQGHLDVLHATSDTDWNACREMRKSTSCGVLPMMAAVQGVCSR